MAAPVRDYHPTTANFEYDDNEWDIGIGDLIIDLDADIEKTGVGEGMAAPKPGKMHSPVEHQATVDKGLKMKIKRTKPGTKHEIVKPGENGERKRGSSGHKKDKKYGEKSVGKDMNGVGRIPEDSPPALKKLKPQSSTNSNSSTCSSKSNGSCSSSSSSSSISSGLVSSPAPPPLTPQLPQPPPNLHLIPLYVSPTSSPPPPTIPLAKQDSVDVCVGTSVGTITEPDCLGPCEPGTSVTLEGIVWHETEGVLVVNVTWRGKTYVGTLLDCTKHDWAPPRFCDSPTSDLDLRLPKGRGKRGRNSANSVLNDLANFTETRSSMHSKLRSNSSIGLKGRRGPTAASPLPFVTPKNEPSTSKRKPKTIEEEPVPKRKPASSLPPSLLPPPVLLECPEPNCSKKYKHINGLKYHQSHAHGVPDDEETKESLTSEEEEPPVMIEIKKEEINELPAPVIEETLDSDSKTPEEVSFCQEETQESPPTPIIHDAVPSTPPPPAIEPSVEIPVSQPSPLSDIPPLQVKPSSALLEEKNLPSPSSTPIMEETQPEEREGSPVPQKSPLMQTIQQQTLPIQEPTLSLQQPTQLSPTQMPLQQQLPSQQIQLQHQNQITKKKLKKSPNSSPHLSPLEPPPLGLETNSREGVQSPAYSDISDDAAPLLESEVEGKPKTADDKKGCQSPPLPICGMYTAASYYPQPPYLVPSVPEKAKEIPCEKIDEKMSDNEKKEGDYHPPKMLSPHYYQYGFHVPGYPYSMDGYPIVLDDKKDEKLGQVSEPKQQITTPTIHIPNPAKLKTPELPLIKEKHQNDNHQIIKESIEMKNQLSSSYMFQRSHQGPEDVRRFYIYSDRKDGVSSKVTPPPVKTHPIPSAKQKDKVEEKRERPDDKKQEGVKPTMETQGPPPPPTSQYTYIHPGYMQSPHYTTLPLDPPGLYRGTQVLLSSYPNYLHPQLHTVPRYTPEDLSRGQSGKSLDLLQHHASQYYSHPSHKIHELQERAIKSPIPKVTIAISSPSSSTSTPATPTPAVTPGQGKLTSTDIKDSRSPPPQRHVHTHHHTHVGLGYPILTGQYPAPYGAAVLATEHAAAITSVPYQTK